MQDDPGFRFIPVSVSKEFRDAVFERYPRLADADSVALAYRRMMQYILLSSFTDKHTGDVVVPFEAVAALVGVSPTKRGFRASDWLDGFSNEVAPLRPSPHWYIIHRARTLRPDFDGGVLVALGHEAQRRRTREGCVWFDTGQAVSVRTEQAILSEAEASLKAISEASVDPSHPAYNIVRYLLDQPQVRAGKLFRVNIDRVQDAILAMPTGTVEEERRRKWCQGLMVSLKTFSQMYYAGSDRTPRVFAIGTSLHQLPSELRRLAFAGCVEFDLRSAQLAVVATLWDIPRLQDFLRSGKSIWEELCRYPGVEIGVHKPILKRTVYSIIFGMRRKNLWQQLSQGTPHCPGVGGAAAQSVLSHPLIRTLLSGRNRATAQILADGGGTDVWGRWIVKEEAREARSVLSEIVQSYEMQLMLPALDVVRREPQMYLVSWLHDGITVLFGNVTKRDYQIGRVSRAVESEAARLGMLTSLEVKGL